jgi:ABC-type branched-subunit amino acid transport system permease subunit
MRLLRPALWLAGLGAIVLFPQISRGTYFVHIGALTCVYIILVLSYDVVVGQLGAISLAHPAFYGIGAYTAGILSTRYDSPFLLNIVLGAILAGVFALLIGFPSFRLSSYTFAMGTLGLALVAQLVATNWIPVTKGPLCLSNIPPVSIGIPGMFNWTAAGTRDDYYVSLALAILVALTIRQVLRSPIGRAFQAIRDDEILAESRGINLLRYRLVGFAFSAMLSGVAGAYVAHFIKVICPTLLAVDVSLTLLIIVFLGGVGNMAGIVAGAVVFTLIPEYLRITSAWRPLIYGVILLLFIVFAPQGFAGLIESGQNRLRSLLGERRGDLSTLDTASRGSQGSRRRDDE